MHNAKLSLRKSALLRVWGRALCTAGMGCLNHERCSAWIVVEIVVEKPQIGGVSVFIDETGDYPPPAVEVPYALDARSGEYREAAEESRPGEAPRPIVRDGIAKVYMS